MPVAVELSGSPSCCFAFHMGPTVGFAQPDPRTVSVVPLAEVDTDLVSPLTVTVPRFWWARAAEGKRGIAGSISAELQCVPESHSKTKNGGKKSSLDLLYANEVTP
jgi:hypothetical protein